MAVMSIFAFAVLVFVCRTNVISAWSPPTKVASRHPPPPLTTPLFPVQCESSIRTPSDISDRKRSRRVPTRMLSSTQSTSWSKHNLSYDSALRALKTFHKENGDLAIPGRFIVPSTDEYPAEWHGEKLASRIYNMKWWQRHVAQHKDRVSQLNELGFLWERLQPTWNLFMEGMVTYRSLYGNALVPASFVVPRDGENWPMACWDLPLGSFVQQVRLRHDFLTGENSIERRRQLYGVGFVWDLSEYNFARLLRALRHFDRLDEKKSSSLRVPSKFVVPSGHENGWPPDLWGYALGAKCAAVRQKQLYVKNHPDRIAQLEDVGFRFSGNARLGWLDVVQAAAIYSQMHNRKLNVPFGFVVPAPPLDVESNPQCVDSWPWPERLWGLKLGQRLKDVRLKGAYLKGADAHVRKAQLDNLGFVWNPPRGRRKRCIEEDEDDNIELDDSCLI